MNWIDAIIEDHNYKESLKHIPIHFVIEDCEIIQILTFEELMNLDKEEKEKDNDTK